MIVAIKEFFTAEMINDVISAAIGLIAFIFLYLLIKKITKKILTKKEKTQAIPTVIRIIRYIIYVLLIIYILGVFNIDISALLGAAGIVGVAVSFASQTSLSNIISGFFILNENLYLVFVIVLKIENDLNVSSYRSTIISICNATHCENELLINDKFNINIAQLHICKKMKNS